MLQRAVTIVVSTCPASPDRIAQVEGSKIVDLDRILFGGREGCSADRRIFHP